MNNKRKSYEFFIKEKYIIFAADETKPAGDAVRAALLKAEKTYIFFPKSKRNFKNRRGNFPECVIKQGSLP